jgi:hypothetical protein
VGVGPAGEDEPRPQERGAPPPARGDDGRPDRLGPRGRAIAGFAFFVLYAISFSLRGLVLPGLVGGVLGGILVYLVFKQMEERSRRRRR